MSAALLFKILIILILLAILVSLASGMFFLVNDKGQTRRTLTSLTVRISLSIALFVLLFIGYAMGLIKPHGLGIESTQTEKALPQAAPSSTKQQKDQL